MKRRGGHQAATGIPESQERKKLAMASRAVAEAMVRMDPRRQLAEMAMRYATVEISRDARRIAKRLAPEDRDILARLSIPELLAIARPGKPRRKPSPKTVILLEASAKKTVQGQGDHLLAYKCWPGVSKPEARKRLSTMKSKHRELYKSLIEKNTPRTSPSE